MLRLYILCIVDENNKRKRGKTSLKSIWHMRGQKLLVNFNDHMQPIGREAKILADFCGLVARQARFCPFIYQDWRHMPSTSKAEMKDFIKVTLLEVLMHFHLKC